jgi:hypothetical protein
MPGRLIYLFHVDPIIKLATRLNPAMMAIAAAPSRPVARTRLTRPSFAALTTLPSRYTRLLMNLHDADISSRSIYSSGEQAQLIERRDGPHGEMALRRRGELFEIIANGAS